jgi:GT2 family glycosyltransferase
LSLATGNYIAIIDDDEFVPRTWLITMYQAIQRFGVDGCLGPVYSFFSQKPPLWLIKGGFWDGTHAYVRFLEGGGHNFSQLLAMFGIELVIKRDL